MAAQKRRHVRGKRISDAFESNQDALETGIRLLSELSALRGLWGSDFDHVRAQALIHEYCARLRRSGREIALARIQRDENLPDGWIVAVLYAVSNQLGLRSGIRSTDGKALAFGCDLPTMRWFVMRLRERKGPGRLLVDSREHGLLPSLELLDLLTGWRLISDGEAGIYRELLSAWPTKTGVEDIGEESPK